MTAKVSFLLATVAGAIFCLLNAAGADLLCLTEGCRIYASYGLFGISFYAYGAAGFLLLFLLGLLHSRPPASIILAVVLVAALVLDTLFLAWQTLFWPCVGCLAVALLLGIAAVAGLFLVPPPARRSMLAAGAVWLVFFVAVALAVGKEIALKPWPIAGDVDAPVKVFFSPECPACRRVVTDLLNDPDTASRTAFFPIVKGEGDRRRLAAFMAASGATAPGADLLPLFEDVTAEAPRLTLKVRLRLLANKAALARTGAVTVPLVIAPDLPERSAPQLNLQPLPAPLFAPGEDDGCPAFEEKKCD